MHWDKFAKYINVLQYGEYYRTDRDKIYVSNSLTVMISNKIIKLNLKFLVIKISLNKYCF